MLIIGETKFVVGYLDLGISLLDMRKKCNFLTRLKYSGQVGPAGYMYIMNKNFILTWRSPGDLC